MASDSKVISARVGMEVYYKLVARAAKDRMALGTYLEGLLNDVVQDDQIKEMGGDLAGVKKKAVVRKFKFNNDPFTHLCVVADKIYSIDKRGRIKSYETMKKKINEKEYCLVTWLDAGYPPIELRNNKLYVKDIQTGKGIELKQDGFTEIEVYE